MRVCVTVGTLNKTPGVGSALYRMSSGAQRPSWACPSVRAPGSTWLEARESSAAAVFAVPDCTALSSGWESGTAPPVSSTIPAAEGSAFSPGCEGGWSGLLQPLPLLAEGALMEGPACLQS